MDGFTHDGEFVLVAEDGANDLKNYPVKCVNGRIWVNNHAHVLQGKARIADNSFLAFAISQSDIESLLVGGGRAKLNAETLMSIEFRLPCLQEQYRIGEYLSQLDNLITLHQRQPFLHSTSEISLTVQLIHPFYTSSWEQRKFGEITSKYEDPVPTPHDGYYRLGIRSHAKGTFHSYVAKGQELETAQMHRVAAGNFIVNITFGWEHAVAITDKNDAGKLVSHRFPQFSFAEGMVPEFFRYVIVDEKFRHHLWLASPGGAGRNRVLKLDEMLNYLMRFPSRDEQIKIAEFFRHLDNLITLHQRKCALLFSSFQALISMMFTTSTFSWEQRKFEEIAVRSSVICSDDTLPRVEYEDIVSGTGRLNKDIYAKQSSKSGIAFHQGDVLYGKLRPYLQNWLLPTFDGLAVGDFWVLQPQNADGSFLYRLIQSRQFDEVANQSTGTKMPRADWKLVSKTVFSIPSNISEQAAIGTYFTALDSLITLHQRKCISFTGRAGRLISTVNKKRITSSWEQRKLSEIADKVTEKNSGLQYVETFTNSAEFGIISQRDFFDHDIAKLSSLDGYYIVKNKDFVYNPRISTSAPVGPINRNKLGRTGVMSPLYTIFRPHDVDTTYLEHFFKCAYWHSFMNFNGDSGARSDRFSIKNDVFFQMPIPLPHIDEQRKIGELLTCLDHLITLHQRKPFLMKWRTSDANRNQTNRLVL